MSEYIECEWEPVLDCDNEDGTHTLWARRVLTDDTKHQNLCFWYIEREEYVEYVGEFYVYDSVNFDFPINICKTLAGAKDWADNKIEEYLENGYFNDIDELEEDEEELERTDDGLEL